MSQITSGTWWKAAGIRAARTALVAAIPYAGATAFTSISWITVLSAALIAGIASLLTSLTGLNEVAGTSVPIGFALLERSVKTAAQTLLAGIGTHLLFQDVDWITVLNTTGAAVVGSLLLGFIASLPESAPPAAAITNVTNVATGEAVAQSAPVVVAEPAHQGEHVDTSAVVDAVPTSETADGGLVSDPNEGQSA